jgi:predicted aspartyl protease
LYSDWQALEGVLEWYREALTREWKEKSRSSHRDWQQVGEALERIRETLRGMWKEKENEKENEKEQEKTLKEQILREYTKQIGSSRFARVTGSATRSFHVQGEVNGHKIGALPDSGAERCYIKDDLARSLGLTPEAGSACEILLPSKEKIQSPGSVDVEWKFSGESKVYSLKCFVLPICHHARALILGANVLRHTKMLTDFRNRIKTCTRPLTRRLGLHLLDSERERVWGFLNGCQTSALGDFGSDIMAISASCAQRLGLRVNKQPHNRIEVEFADGSSAITAGMVFGVDWMFGDAGAVFKCDFHVLNNLPADVILSNEFLWEQDVFSNYGQYFYNLESSGSPKLSLITHIGYFSDKLQSLYEVFRNNGMGFLSL